MRDWKILIGAGLALLIGLVLATQVDAGWFRNRHQGHDPDRMREHAYRIVDHTFSRVDASDAQHEAARAIVDETLEELGEVRFDRRAMHEEVMGLLTAETVDHAAVEALRAEKLASADRASRVLTRGLVALADLLTPEQRAQLPGIREGHGAWH